MANVTKSGFRPDIEGLRCIAVVAVLFFHLDPEWLPGGFQGVDIFFVISGYLITRVILEPGPAFSYKQFYIRRYWRLLPALFVTVAATLIASYWVLSPRDYAILGQSSLSAALGVSNFFFYAHLDYFNDNTLAHPLLHTWSLGVEEQFYLFWPLLVVAAGRVFGVARLVVIVFAASLVFMLLAGPLDPQLAFYMMPFRIFQFAAGAALLLYEKRLPEAGRTLAGLAGATLVVASLILFDESHLWPGLAALPLTLGTVMLIHAGKTAPWSGILGNPVFLFLGRISYALYLVHWPIITLYRYWRVVPPSLAELAALAIACIATALLLHVVIERSFRMGGRDTGLVARLPDIRNTALWPRIKHPIMASVAVATAAMAITVWTTDGLPRRIKNRLAQNADNRLTYGGDICAVSRTRRCILGDPASRQHVYVVGDSHAGNLFYGLHILLREHGIKGIAIMDNGCPFLFRTTRIVKGRRDENCAKATADAYTVMARDRAPIILTAGYTGYATSIVVNGQTTAPGRDAAGYAALMTAQLSEGLKLLNADERPVLLVKSAYDSGIDTARCLSRPNVAPGILEHECKPWGLEENVNAFGTSDIVLDEVAARFRGVRTLDPKQAMCDRTGCTVVKNGAFLLRDMSHLTNAGSKLVIERLRGEILAGIGAQKAP